MLNSRELATVLAGLRLVQHETRQGPRNLPDAIEEIATDGGKVAPLTADEIDSLCERINAEPKPGDPIKAWVLTIVHRHGQDTSLFSSHADAHAELAAFVDEWWPRELGDREKPSDPQEAVDAYFELVGESYSLTESSITLPVPAPSKLPSLAVIMEGGLVQDIVSDMPEAVKVEAIYVIDYDTEGADGNDVSYVRQSEGDYSDALVHQEGIGKAKIDFEQIDLDDRARDAAIEAGWIHNRFETAFTHPSGKESESETWADLCKEQEIEIE